MIDHRFFRDCAIALLLAVPTVTLGRPQPAPQKSEASVQPLVEQAALADRTTAERRFALPA